MLAFEDGFWMNSMHSHIPEVIFALAKATACLHGSGMQNRDHNIYSIDYEGIVKDTVGSRDFFVSHPITKMAHQQVTHKILENCILIQYKDREATVSALTWSAFAYFRVIHLDYANKQMQGTLTITLPDDFGEIFDLFTTSNTVPKDSCVCYEYAVRLREQALCLGVDSVSNMSGYVESVITRASISYSRSYMIQLAMEFVWGKPDSALPWSSFFLHSLHVQDFVVNSILPLSSEMIDIRNLSVLCNIKQSEHRNEKEQLLHDIAVMVCGPNP